MFFFPLLLSNEANWIILSIYLCTQQPFPPTPCTFYHSHDAEEEEEEGGEGCDCSSAAS